ncbi:CesT family type III secretion system chaperone [Hahella ganghwensis]|uniref:CesT family type III secretion system chaperone n=1 Tax=Hahella ganghwensis TaxID=286420 RepID=UPI000375FED4|nr:CesT family type III secretion system chaperone [Hahella ganghwensis]
MSIAQNINEWLKQLGNDTGATFKLDGNHQCILASTNEYQTGIFVPDDSGKVYFTSEIMELPQENREAYLLNSLGINLFQQVTQGAAVSYDPTSNYLILSHTQEMLAKDYDEFESALNNIIGVAKDIRENLQELAHKTPVSGTQSEEGSSAGLIRA